LFLHQHGFLSRDVAKFSLAFFRQWPKSYYALQMIHSTGRMKEPNLKGEAMRTSFNSRIQLIDD
jgi:hypothetical protein